MKVSKPKHPNALAAPPIALKDPKATEIMRAWIVGGGLQVTMIPGFDSPDTWGLLLVDIARHASRMFEGEGVCSAEQAMERIRALWNAEVSRPTDLGATERSQ